MPYQTRTRSKKVVLITGRRAFPDDLVLNEAMPPQPSDVLTLREAAAYMRCHPKTLRLMAIRGDIPARRVGHLWRFSRIELEKWMREWPRKRG